MKKALKHFSLVCLIISAYLITMNSSAVMGQNNTKTGEAEVLGINAQRVVLADKILGCLYECSVQAIYNANILTGDVVRYEFIGEGITDEDGYYLIKIQNMSSISPLF